MRVRQLRQRLDPVEHVQVSLCSPSRGLREQDG